MQRRRKGRVPIGEEVGEMEEKSESTLSSEKKPPFRTWDSINSTVTVAARDSFTCNNDERARTCARPKLVDRRAITVGFGLGLD